MNLMSYHVLLIVSKLSLYNVLQCTTCCKPKLSHITGVHLVGHVLKGSEALHHIKRLPATAITSNACATCNSQQM